MFGNLMKFVKQQQTNYFNERKKKKMHQNKLYMNLIKTLDNLLAILLSFNKSKKQWILIVFIVLRKS